jgi:hypothetical protein
MIPLLIEQKHTALTTLHGERVAEHRVAAFGLLLSRLVLDDVPMLDEYPILNPHNVRGDPVRGSPETRKTAVDDDEITVSHDEARIVLQRRGEAPDEVK